MLFHKNEHPYLKVIGLVTVAAPLVYKAACLCYDAYKNREVCDPLRPKEKMRFGENKDKDIVDEAIDESFPASDPPAHAARLD